MDCTPKQLYAYMQSHQSQVILNECTAQLDAANAHCTIVHRHITTLTEQLANKSLSKRRKSKKIQAWFVTLPELREVLEAEDAELEAKEKVELEKAAKKKADDTARMLRINYEIESHIFDCPLTSYKRKADLIALAGALSLSIEGTVAELTKAIKVDIILLVQMSHGLADFLALQESALHHQSPISHGRPNSASAASLLARQTPPLFRLRRTIIRRVSSRRHDTMSHIHVPCTLHTMSHNIPLMPPGHTSHIN